MWCRDLSQTLQLEPECTCGAEVEEHGQISAAGQASVGLAQLVKEGV